MDIKQVMKWTITLLAVLAFQYTEANGLPADVYRVKYDETVQMPDHFAYLTLMQNLVLAEQESGTEANIAHVQTHLSLDQERAEAFLGFVLASYDDMIAVNRAITNRMLCAGQRPKYETNKAYAVLDVLDDIKETNLRKQYKHVLLNFGTRTAVELETWLAVIKTGASHHKYDHRQVFAHSGESVEQVILTACNVLAARAH